MADRHPTRGNNPCFPTAAWIYGPRFRFAVVRHAGLFGTGPSFHVILCRRAGYDPRRKAATFVAHLLNFNCRTPADEPAGRASSGRTA